MFTEALQDNERFREFVAQVQEEFTRLQPESPDRSDSLRAELQALEQQCDGWMQSLGDRDLSRSLRLALQEKYDRSQDRIATINADLNSSGARSRAREQAIDPARIAACLQKLEGILAGQNASATNLMLSQHIDGIYCDTDGKVVVRTCRLGALAGSLDLLPRQEVDAVDYGGNDGHSIYRAIPRRRTKRDVGDAMEDDEVLEGAIEFAVDPERFAGLGAQWFTEAIFQVPERLSWSQAHAREVAEYRLQTKKSMALTALHFGKTIPTIRAALDYAKQTHGLDALGTQISMSTRSNWSREHAAEVEDFFAAKDATMKAAVAHFGKSPPTIQKALEFAKAKRKAA